MVLKSWRFSMPLLSINYLISTHGGILAHIIPTPFDTARCDSNVPLRRRDDMVVTSVEHYTGNKLYIMGAMVVVLILIAGLVSGLTLGIMSLDITWLNLIKQTGTPVQRYALVDPLQAARDIPGLGRYILYIFRLTKSEKSALTGVMFKRAIQEGSLIIVNCAINESLPLILTSIFPPGPAALLISTFSIAIFGDLFPQIVIPRYILPIAATCAPFVWLCIILTCPVSIPCSIFVDWIFQRHSHEHRPERGLLTKSGLKLFLKWHEEAAGMGGWLSEDTGKILRMVLEADQETVGAAVGLGTQWSAFPVIDVNRIVTAALLEQLTRRAVDYMVVIQGNDLALDEIEEVSILGYIHIKDVLTSYLHLAGLDACLPIRDLPLHALHIIPAHLSLHDLLTILRLSPSPLAIVVPTPSKDSHAPLSTHDPKNRRFLPENQESWWSGRHGLHGRDTVRRIRVSGMVTWTAERLAAFKNSSPAAIRPRRGSIIGALAEDRPLSVITLGELQAHLLAANAVEEDVTPHPHPLSQPPLRKRNPKYWLSYGAYPSPHTHTHTHAQREHADRAERESGKPQKIQKRKSVYGMLLQRDPVVTTATAATTTTATTTRREGESEKWQGGKRDGKVSPVRRDPVVVARRDSALFRPDEGGGGVRFRVVSAPVVGAGGGAGGAGGGAATTAATATAAAATRVAGVAGVAAASGTDEALTRRAPVLSDSIGETEGGVVRTSLPPSPMMTSAVGHDTLRTAEAAGGVALVTGLERAHRGGTGLHSVHFKEVESGIGDGAGDGSGDWDGDEDGGGV